MTTPRRGLLAFLLYDALPVWREGRDLRKQLEKNAKAVGSLLASKEALMFEIDRLYGQKCTLENTVRTLRDQRQQLLSERQLVVTWAPADNTEV